MSGCFWSYISKLMSIFSRVEPLVKYYATYYGVAPNIDLLHFNIDVENNEVILDYSFFGFGFFNLSQNELVHPFKYLASSGVFSDSEFFALKFSSHLVAYDGYSSIIQTRIKIDSK